MKRKLFKTLLFFILTILLSIFYCLTSWNVSIDSDSATIVLQANSILHSNFLLDGWSMSTGTYYTTDLIFYVVGILVFGISTKVIYVVTAVQYALMVVIASALSSKDKDGESSLFKFFLTFFVLGVPSVLLSNMVFSGPMHIGGMVYVLVALYSLVYMKGVCKWIVYLSFLTLALIGDQFIIWIFVLPIVIVCILRIIVNDNRKREFLIIGLSISAYILKMLVLMFFKFKEISSSNMLFATYDQIFSNLKLTVEGLLGIYGANFFGKPFSSMVTLITLVHLIIMLLVFFVIYKNIRSGIIKTDRMTQILIVGIVLNIAEYLFSNMAVNINTTRYLIPTLVYTAILFAKTVHGYKLANQNKKLVISMMVVVLLISIPTLKFGRSETTHDRLTKFLADNNLKYGYGSYFNASTITLRSGGAVSVRPVITDGTTYSRFDWLSDINWYNDYSNFLVFDQTNWGNINLENAVAVFGEPATSYQFENLNILVWDKDLSKIIYK